MLMKNLLFLSLGIISTQCCLTAQELSSSCQSNKPNKEVLPSSKQQNQQQYNQNLSDSKSTPSFFVSSLDYLIARAYNPAFVFAYEKKGVITPGAFDNRVVQGNMIYPNKTWRPGFRLGVGWTVPEHEWSLFSQWTYYYNKSVTNRGISPGEIVSGFSNGNEGYIGLWASRMRANFADINPSSGITFLSFQGTWLLNYNLIDLGAKKLLVQNDSFDIAMNFSLETGWIHQKSTINYFHTTTNPIYFNQLVRLSNNFWGLGLKTGFTSNWKLGYGISIFGDLSAAMLSGRTTSRNVQSAFGPNQSNSGTVDPTVYSEALRFANFADRITHYSPGVDASFGVAYLYKFSSERKLLLQAGWESQLWWGQQKMLLPTVTMAGGTPGSALNYIGPDYQEAYPPNSGILTIEGFTVRGQIDF